MSQISSVKAPASKSGTSTLSTPQASTAPTSQPAANNSRGPETQGNNITEKKLIRELSPDEREELVEPVLKAMEDDERLQEYFLDPLYNLFAEGEANEVYMHKLFIKSLMIMALKPKNAKLLNKSFGRDGHKYFEKLYSFFDALEDDDVVKWSDYITLDRYSSSVTVGKVHEMAQAYVPTKSPQTAILYDLNRIVQRPLAMDPEEESITLTEEQLVEALDRYFPGHQWPADKKAVATHERMKAHLVAREKERLSILTETPEQKAKRLVNDAVYTAVNGPNIPARLSQIEKAVGVKPTAAPAKKPTSKPSTSKKKA